MRKKRATTIKAAYKKENQAEIEAQPLRKWTAELKQKPQAAKSSLSDHKDERLPQCRKVEVSITESSGSNWTKGNGTTALSRGSDKSFDNDPYFGHRAKEYRKYLRMACGESLQV